MTQIERVTQIPQLIWTCHCSLEFESENIKSIEERSDFIWVVKTDVVIAVAGLIYTTLTSPPWLWFLLTKEFEEQPVKAIKFLIKLSEFLPSGTQTAVNEEFKAGVRFAALFGFNPIALKQGSYDIYRRA